MVNNTHEPYKRYDILSKYDDDAVSFTVNPNKGKYAALTAAYDEMNICFSRLTELKNEMEHDFNPNKDIYFTGPLKFGPRKEIENSIQDCKEGFIKFIIEQQSSESTYKNLIIDEDLILKQFGIGYESIEKYGPGFDAKDVVDCFNEIYPLDGIENRIYNQILDVSKRSLPWAIGQKVPIIERFKDGLGVILSYCTSNYYGTNENYTTSLTKLIEITFTPVKPSNSVGIYVNVGETYSSLSYTSLRGYKNSKLKILFKTRENADTICNLLLKDDKEDAS